MRQNNQAQDRSTQPTDHSPEKSDGESEVLSTSPPVLHRDDEEFVPVNHEDVEDVNENYDESEMERVLRPFLGLQRQMVQRNRGPGNKYDDLHPYSAILSLSHIEDCVKLENTAFPEHERCSREKFMYRLTRCPELSLGIFSRPVISETDENTPRPRSELIAHIVATRTPAPAVTDASMSFPENWKSQKSSLPSPINPEPLGHQEQGGTIALHSLAVAPEHQKKGLGSILLKAYVQRIKDSKIADRIALLAHDHLVGFYEKSGFTDMGESSSQFGGGGWNNMILEFHEHDED